MTRTKDYIQPAFPVDNPSSHETGITIRDYFAAMAMQGIIAASGDSCGEIEYDEPILAASAYLMADEMMKERER